MKEITAIIASGGAMKCAWGGGVFAALHDHYRYKPDICIAVSGNAGSAAYYVSGQIEAMRRIWTEHLSGDAFVSFRSYPHVFNLSYLIDSMMFGKEHLNVEEIMSSSIDLYVPATNLQTGDVRWFSGTHPKEEIKEVFRAAMAVIVGWGDPVMLGGAPYGDSPISWSLHTALVKAKELGATRIIIIDNHDEVSFFEKMIYRYLIPGKSHAFEDRLWNSIEQAENLSVPGAEIVRIRPSTSLSPLAREHVRLAHIFDTGYKDAVSSKELQSFM